MTASSWRSVQDDLDSCGEVVGDPFGRASGHFALNSGLNPDRPHTGIVSAFDVTLLIANQKRTGKIDLMVSRGLDDHPRRGLAAIRMLRGSVWAEVSRVDQPISKLAQHFSFYCTILIECEESAPDAALVCDDN
jgi:hypothetical protein